MTYENPFNVDNGDKNAPYSLKGKGTSEASHLCGPSKHSLLREELGAPTRWRYVMFIRENYKHTEKATWVSKYFRNDTS